MMSYIYQLISLQQETRLEQLTWGRDNIDTLEVLTLLSDQLNNTLK